MSITNFNDLITRHPFRAPLFEVRGIIEWHHLVLSRCWAVFLVPSSVLSSVGYPEEPGHEEVGQTECHCGSMTRFEASAREQTPSRKQ